MRRRQIYAAAFANAMATRVPASDPQTTALQVPILPVETAPGTCPTCLKHIGKGIAIHKRNCRG